MILTVGAFPVMLCDFLLWCVDCFYILLGSVASCTIRGAHDSHNRCYLYEENEYHINNKDVISLRGNCNGTTGRESNMHHKH